MSAFDEESYWVQVTPVWHLGATHQAHLNLARLDVNKSGEMMMHDLHKQGETTVTIEGDEDAATKIIDKVITTDTNEAVAVLLSALAAALLIGMVVYFRKQKPSTE